MELSPKVLAYLRASEVIARTRAEAGRYDRPTAAAINKELKLIANRLRKSAHKAYDNELLKAALDKDPDFAKNYAEVKKTQRYLNAAKTVQKLEPELVKQYEERQ